MNKFFFRTRGRQPLPIHTAGLLKWPYPWICQELCHMEFDLIMGDVGSLIVHIIMNAHRVGPLGQVLLMHVGVQE